jgi:hypothetical protein
LFVMSCFDLKKNQLLDSSLDKRVLTNFVWIIFQFWIF